MLYWKHLIWESTGNQPNTTAFNNVTHLIAMEILYTVHPVSLQDQHTGCVRTQPYLDIKADGSSYKDEKVPDSTGTDGDLIEITPTQHQPISLEGTPTLETKTWGKIPSLPSGTWDDTSLCHPRTPRPALPKTGRALPAQIRAFPCFGETHGRGCSLPNPEEPPRTTQVCQKKTLHVCYAMFTAAPLGQP